MFYFASLAHQWKKRKRAGQVACAPGFSLFSPLHLFSLSCTLILLNLFLFFNLIVVILCCLFSFDIKYFLKNNVWRTWCAGQPLFPCRPAAFYFYLVHRLARSCKRAIDSKDVVGRKIGGVESEFRDYVISNGRAVYFRPCLFVGILDLPAIAAKTAEYRFSFQLSQFRIFSFSFCFKPKRKLSRKRAFSSPVVIEDGHYGCFLLPPTSWFIFETVAMQESIGSSRK